MNFVSLMEKPAKPGISVFYAKYTKHYIYIYKYELTESHSSCEVGGSHFLRFFQSTSLFRLIGLHMAKQAAAQPLSSRGIKNQLLSQGLTASPCLGGSEVLPEVEAGCQFIN